MAKKKPKATTAGKSPDFRRTKKVKFKNVVLEAEWEHKLKPWMIIISVQFYGAITEKAAQDFGSTNELHQWLAEKKLGAGPLKRSWESEFRSKWNWVGAYEMHDHTLSKFNFPKNVEKWGNKLKVQKYGVGLYVEEAMGFGDEDRWQDMKKYLEGTVFKKVANFDNFKSDKYIKFSAQEKLYKK